MKVLKMITKKWCDSGIIEKTDEDVYEYGLDLLLFTAINIVVILGSAALIRKIIDGIFVLAVILPLQSFGGGYHAKTHFRCFLIMFIIWWVVALILPFITPTAALIMICLAVVAVYWLAPVAHENVKMSLKQRMKMRNMARIIVSASALMSAIFILCLYKRIGIAMATGLGVTSLSMLVAYGSKKRTKRTA
jgi:accessory gene regulator B